MPDCGGEWFEKVFKHEKYTEGIRDEYEKIVNKLMQLVTDDGILFISKIPKFFNQKNDRFNAIYAQSIYNVDLITLRKDNYKEKTKQPPIIDRYEWVCPKCTLINDEDSVVCSACEMPNITKLSLGTIEQKQWKCPSCTFLNAQKLLYCEMCESPRTKGGKSKKKVKKEI